MTPHTSVRLFPVVALVGAGCVEPDLPPPAWYDCDPSVALGNEDPSAHPEAARYQRVVDDGLRLGIPAVSVAVISPEGTRVSAGGLVSTPLDIARFLRALVHGEVVGADLVETEMMDARAYDEGGAFETAYGLGLGRLETRFGPAWGHYGSVYPYQALAYHFEDHDTTVVVSINGIVEGWDAWFLRADIFETVLGEAGE